MSTFEKNLPARCLRGLKALSLVVVAAAVSSAADAQVPAPDPQDPNASQRGPIVVCFAEGTDPDYIATTQDLVDLINGSNYFLGGRWSGTQGTPRALTWSLVPDGLSIPGGIGEGTAPSNLFAQMDAKFAGSGGRATWIARIQSSFDRWQQLSGLSFTRITSGGNDWDDGAFWGANGSASRGDIRISMHAIDGGNGVLAYTEFPSGGDMVFDSAESWGGSTNLHRFFRNTVMHELGHAFGIEHVCSNNASFLMEPFLSTGFDGPQHDDIRGCERHYGDPFEADDTAATANDLGTIPSGTTLSNTCNVPAGVSGSAPANTSICSLDANAEVDFWKFTIASGSLVTVTLTPQGFTYDDTEQTQSNPNCAQANHTTNSLTISDLKLELIASNGTTVVATAPTQPAGAAESVTNVSMPAGLVFIRVSDTNTPTQSQMYKLSISVQNNCAGAPDCNSNGIRDNCDIAAGTSLDNNLNGIPDECDGFNGMSFCAGDQLDIFFTPCPCDNAGSEGHGCANSVDPDGALLKVSGNTNPTDTLFLIATEMPATVSSIFLKGDTNASNGILFGDGVRCVDGNLIRLGTATNVAGSSVYPSGLQQPISVRGFTPVGSGFTGYYQTYYRNAAGTFCPPETFNVTNGFIVVW